MAKLVIEGGIGQLAIIAKTERGRVNKYGLKMTLEEDKVQEVKKSPELIPEKPKEKKTGFFGKK